MLGNRFLLSFVATLLTISFSLAEVVPVLSEDLIAVVDDIEVENNETEIDSESESNKKWYPDLSSDSGDDFIAPIGRICVPSTHYLLNHSVQQQRVEHADGTPFYILYCCLKTDL